MLIEIEGDRIAARRRAGVGARRHDARAPRRASRCRASRTRTRTRSSARCAAARTRGRARSGPGASRCTSSPARSTPTPASRSRARRSARWRWPASPASASSTTSTTRRTARPTTTRTRWAAPCWPRRPRRGVRITLLDACYLHGGIERFRDADADAWAERVDALAERPTARVGAAIHSVRAVDPESARDGGGVGGGAAAARARLRAAEGERGVPRGARPHADRAARRRRRAVASASPPSTRRT